MKKIAVIIVVVLMAQLTLAQGRMANYKPVPTFKNMPTYKIDVTPTRSFDYKVGSTTLSSYKPAHSALHTNSSQEVQSFGGHGMVGNGEIRCFRSTSKAPSSVAMSLTSSTRISGFDPAAHPTLGSTGIAEIPHTAIFHAGDTRPGSGDGQQNGGTGGSSGAGTQIPVGGPVLPMLLLMAGYVIVRRRLAQQHND